MTGQVKQRSRIQQKNRQVILGAALQEFSARGFAGTTIDQIAEQAALSKPNVLYYFASKEEIYRQLLEELLDLWLAPLQRMEAGGDPKQEIISYMRAKLQLSRDFPRESRLFANEILQGAPQLGPILGGALRQLVADKAEMISRWIAQGRLAVVDPHHLIISIWALTQHYADFETQIRAVLGAGRDPFSEADSFLEELYCRLLAN
ncbi:TetR family transcriptional regulator C-terminal domain-containing protein [Paracoccus aminophilus]|uniref:Transcriptional regulator, TetR family n=1 Tax=Paracoccus aminophilus JCM 7686 TaxID=1367847 RepID=S5XN41_PARAH|nr:TetR family transcriptional regulator C-terminal domain-containing protein [Paracoccus aminophilus]AGT08714.1 transcriptional regulator, TetR family [Paracoccus aminophilus JCM 7686]